MVEWFENGCENGLLIFLINEHFLLVGVILGRKKPEKGTVNFSG